MSIHPTAIVHPKAKVASDVTVGPYSLIGEKVVMGKGCWVGSHCVIEGRTHIGENNRFYTGAVIGTIPQDLKYKDEETSLEIGDDNNFREYVTVNLGTVEGGGKTRIGNHVHIMAYSHIAHDCSVGDDVIIANNGTLGGHVEIEEKAIIGGFGTMHQFVRVGKLAIVGGCSKVTQDVLPFVTVSGDPARVYGLNHLGLKRVGMKPEIQRELKRALQILFRQSLLREEALERIEAECGQSPEVAHFVDFIRRSKRGICTPVRHAAKEPLWSD